MPSADMLADNHRGRTLGYPGRAVVVVGRAVVVVVVVVVIAGEAASGVRGHFHRFDNCLTQRSGKTNAPTGPTPSAVQQNMPTICAHCLKPIAEATLNIFEAGSNPPRLIASGQAHWRPADRRAAAQATGQCRQQCAVPSPWSRDWRLRADRARPQNRQRHRKAVRVLDDEASVIGFLKRPGRRETAFSTDRHVCR